MASFTAPAIAGIVGAGASVAGAANSIFGGGASGTVPNTYIPSNASGADSNYNQLLDASLPYAYSVQANANPQYQALYNSIANDPYATQAQGGANQAAYYGSAEAGDDFNNAGQLGSSSLSLLPYATQIMQQGMDPQRAAYNQNYNTTMQQSNAINAMNGVAGTPYGAGLQQNAGQNFNIAWNAQQLQNMTNAASAAGGLVNTAGQGLTGASNLLGQSTNAEATSQALPYSTYLTPYNNDMTALNSYVSGITGSSGLSSNLLNALGAYLGLTNNATATGISGANSAFNQQQVLGQGLGSSLAALSNLNYGGSGSTPSASYYNSIPDSSYYDTTGSTGTAAY